MLDEQLEENRQYNKKLIENIKRIAASQGKTFKSIEEALNFGNGVIAGWAKAKKKAPHDRVLAIADHLKVDISALVNDRDSYNLIDRIDFDNEKIMSSGYLASLSEEEREEYYMIEELKHKFFSLDNYGFNVVKAVIELEYKRCTDEEQEDEDEEVPTIRHYLYSPAAGVNGLVSGEDFEDIPMPEDCPSDADYCLTVSGDSMMPIIHDGEMIYVKRDVQLRQRDVGVFAVDGCTFVKEFVKGDDGTLFLRSINPDRKDSSITIKPDSTSSVVCYGKVLLP